MLMRLMIRTRGGEGTSHNFCCPDPNEKIWILVSSVFAEIYFLDDFITNNPHTENKIN